MNESGATLSTTVLIVEDERDMAEGLRNAFERHGFDVLTAKDGEAGLELARSGRADLIILDLMLPKLDGTEVCRQVRSRGIQTPIIMLTARGQVADRIAGLDVGADDYVTKPFSLRELVARARAHLRRDALGQTGVEQVRIGEVTVDFKQYAVFKGAQKLPLTTRELAMLRLLVSHPHQVITRERLLKDVWGYDAFPTTRTIDTFVYRLRNKIEKDPKRPKHLLKVHGAGYQFNP